MATPKKNSTTNSAIARAGSALVAPSKAKPKSSGGVGSAGSALLAPTTSKSSGASGAASGGAAGLGAPAATTTTTGAPPIAPFLTAAQGDALAKWNVTYAGDLANLTNDDTKAMGTYNSGVNTDTFKNSENVDTANQDAAARGMFQSSIRQGALNDLAVTLASQLNVLQTNRDTSLSADQTQRTTLGGEDAATQTEYWGPGGLAVANAQAVPPDTAQSTTSATTPGTSAPGAAHNASTSAPTSTLAPGVSSAGAALTAPHTPSLAAAGSALISHAAALRAANPKPAAMAKPPGKNANGYNLSNGAFNQLGGAAGKVGAPV